MGENANNFGEAVGLEYIEEFKSFLEDTQHIAKPNGRFRHTISNPNDPSIMRRTRSAILPMSIIELRSLLHSMKVRRLFLPLTTVTGPRISDSVCLVYRRTRLLTKVLLPTPGGPTMATMTGGGRSSGVRSTRGTWRRV